MAYGIQERVYCTDNRKPSIFAAAMAQFRDFVLRASMPSARDVKIMNVLLSVILNQVRMEREGDIIDKTLIRSCAYMLEGLYESEEEEETAKLYLTEFEPAYLSATREFYRAEGISLMQDSDAGTFCRHAMRRASEEQDRCRSTLSALTSPKVKVVVDEELIKSNIGSVINMPSGVNHMLDNDRMGELQLVYELISRVDPKKEELKKAVQKRIVDLGIEINHSAMNPSSEPAAKPSDPGKERQEGESKAPAEKSINLQTAAAIKWVDDVLQLKAKYDKVLADAFAADQGLQTAFARSFTDFINEFERSSEYLSLFFDENMKKGIKGKTENEVDALLDRGITLLRYIQDKDMFERYYKKHLSKRLLMKRSVSMDAERQMISKMKLEVGNTFTQRIESMFKDMAVSEDLSANYRTHVSQLGDPDPKRAEIDVNVLTSTMWPLDAMGPSYRDDETERRSCIFPSQIERIKQGFQKYYLDKHSGRRLTWQANMGTADIRAYFPEMKGTKKTRELNVSTYAMVILLLFNDLPSGASLTCEEIQDKTNIPINELTRNLQSLAVAPKTRVLIKEPMSKDVNLTDKFSFNEHFHSPFQKVKIGVVSSGNKVEAQSERKETEQKIDDARTGTIEAALVRIMKYALSNLPLTFQISSVLTSARRQRKELSHQGLVTEAIQQLLSRFRPDPVMIKARIESLIDRDYLARIEDREPPAYRYLA